MNRISRHGTARQPSEIFLTSCQDTADGVVVEAREAGLRVAIERIERGGAEAWRVRVEGTSGLMRALVRQSQARLQFIRAWQGFVAPPNTLSLWQLHFRQWLAARPHDGTCPSACPSAAHRGGWHSGEFLDLSDPLTFSYFLDYLNEFPERRRAWKKFERNSPAK
jgi:hypothetical protein